MSEPTTADKPQEAVASDSLLAVALLAAQCCIDLDANLRSTHEEYMRGEIAHGAFQYVLQRHTNLHAALHAAGFTEKHPIFGWPMRPDSSVNGALSRPESL